MNAVSDLAPRWEPFVILLLLLLATSAAAQTPPPRDPARPATAPTRDQAPVRTTGTGVVKGKVVDGVTGAAIARARVRLAGGPNSRGTVLTDGEGMFTITGLVPAAVSVVVDKSTYMTARYPDNAGSLRARLTPTTIADGQVMEVAIKMFHGGVITGRVVDSYGDPLEFVQVQAMFLPRGGAPVTRNGATTNDIGEFRLSRLDPGRYVLNVVPRNVNADPVGVSASPQPQPTPVFYPGMASVEQAQAIVLNRGEIVSGIEIVLGEATPTVLIGTVIGPESVMSKTSGNVSARLLSLGSNWGPPTGSAPILQDGTFRFQLVPGQYVLEARVNPQLTPGEVYQPNRELYGMAQVLVSGGQTDSVTIVIGKGATASGRVVFEGTSQVPAAPVGRPMRPPIFNEDSATGCRTGEAAFAEDWTFKIDGLFGTCGAPASRVFGRWTVKSVRIGGANPLQKPVTFEQGRHYNDVEIVVTDKPTQLELRVAGDDGQVTREYAALAFPVEKARWKEGPRAIRTLVPSKGPSGSSVAVAGAFGTNPGPPRDLINAMTPGEYYVISLDDIDQEDANDPTVLEKLASHATRVTVAPESSNEVTLQRLKMADIIR